MALFIDLVSQKGGVGKSTLARLLAREYANSGWTVKIADMDVSQGTSCEWARIRMDAGLSPEVAAEQFPRVDRALSQADQYDLVIFDGAPHSTRDTLGIAKVSDLVILPTGFSLDDLKPTVRLAHELKQSGVPKERIVFTFTRAGDSTTELQEAALYLEQTGYKLLPGYIPDRTAYRRASDTGRALTEMNFPSLNAKADALVQSIGDCLTSLTNEGTDNGQSVTTTTENEIRDREGNDRDGGGHVNG